MTENLKERVVAETTLHGLISEEKGLPDVNVRVVTDKPSIDEFLYGWAQRNFGVSLGEYIRSRIMAAIYITPCDLQDDYQGEEFSALLVDEENFCHSIRFATCTPGALYINGEQVA